MSLLLDYMRCAGDALEDGNLSLAKLYVNKGKDLLEQAEWFYTEFAEIYRTLISREETAELYHQMAKNPEIAYAISNGLAQGISDSKIKFDEDMTFGAFLFVTKKPEFSSQVITDIGGKLQFSYLTEPKIMKIVGAKILRERINQRPEPLPSEIMISWAKQ